MKRAATIFLAALAAALAGCSGQAPVGQPPLAEINGQALDALQAEFNRQASAFRIVLLLSPT